MRILRTEKWRKWNCYWLVVTIGISHLVVTICFFATILQDSKKMATKKAITSAKEKTIIPKQSGKIQYRCNMVAFQSTMDKIKDDLTPKAYEKLQKTPFWPLINAFRNEMMGSNPVKSDDGVGFFIQAYNKETEKFHFGKKEVELTTSDIADLFGLPELGNEVLLTKKGFKKSKFITDHFKDDEQRINRTSVQNALYKAVEEGKQPQTPAGNQKTSRKRRLKDNSDDVVRLIILYLLATFLFPNSGYHLAWDLVKQKTAHV